MRFMLCVWLVYCLMVVRLFLFVLFICGKLGHTRSFNIKYLKGINIEKGKENKGVNLAIVVVIDVYIVCDDGRINLTC